MALERIKIAITDADGVVLDEYIALDTSDMGNIPLAQAVARHLETFVGASIVSAYDEDEIEEIEREFE